jgi:hypothetical protein
MGRLRWVLVAAIVWRRDTYANGLRDRQYDPTVDEPFGYGVAGRRTVGQPSAIEVREGDRVALSMLAERERLYNSAASRLLGTERSPKRSGVAAAWRRETCSSRGREARASVSNTRVVCIAEGSAVLRSWTLATTLIRVRPTAARHL